MENDEMIIGDKRRSTSTKNNYNFFKIVTIVVNFCSGIVKFDCGLRNNILEFAPSFILLRKIILCF